MKPLDEPHAQLPQPGELFFGVDMLGDQLTAERARKIPDRQDLSAAAEPCNQVATQLQVFRLDFAHERRGKVTIAEVVDGHLRVQ